MKILVTGAKGMLGSSVLERLNVLGIPAAGVDIGDFDIASKEKTLEFFNRIRPGGVIHCAAYTAVDAAEDDAELCLAVNFGGTKNIAQACAVFGARLLYVSSEYVFGSNSQTPLNINDPKQPLNVYGRSKLLGEEAVLNSGAPAFIVRTSWLFGPGGNNFIDTILRLAKKNETLSVVCDQIGSPCYAPDLAETLCNLIQTKKFGIYHAANSGFCSRSELAREAVKLAGLNTRVNDILSENYFSKAKRQLNSRLNCHSLEHAGFSKMPPWQSSLQKYIDLLPNIVKIQEINIKKR